MPIKLSVHHPVFYHVWLVSTASHDTHIDKLKQLDNTSYEIWRWRSMLTFEKKSPQSKIPFMQALNLRALGAIFGSSFLLEKVPISLKDGSPFWNVLAQPSPYLADPLPNAPTVLTLKFTKGAECRTPRSRMQHQCTCDSTRKASETSGVSPWSRASQSTAWQWCATLPPSRPWWRAWAASWLLMRPHLRSPSSSQSSPPKTCV